MFGMSGNFSRFRGGSQREWEFSPSRFVKRVFSKNPRTLDNRYALEGGIDTFLFYLWTLWPSFSDAKDDWLQTKSTNLANSELLRGAARCLGALVTFTALDDIGFDNEVYVLGEPIDDEKSLRNQIQMEWYTKLSESYLKPLGGLRAQIISGQNCHWYDNMISERCYATTLARDIVRYYVCTSVQFPEHARQKSLLDAFKFNIFEREKYRQRARPNSPELASGSKLEDAIQKGLPTAAILYSIYQVFPRITTTKFSDIEGLVIDLNSIYYHNNNMRDVILHHKKTMQTLEPVLSRTPSLRRLRVISVEETIPIHIVDQFRQKEVFTEAELKIFKTVFPNSTPSS